MDASAIVSVISGIATIISVVITVWRTQSKTLYRLDELEKKVDKHDKLSERISVIETVLEIRKGSDK